MPGKRSRKAPSELESLRERLREAEEALSAIRSGEADSILVPGAGGTRVYALDGALAVYRKLIDGMNEGAVSLDRNGVITYCNGRFAAMVARPLEEVMGAGFLDLVGSPGRAAVARFLRLAWTKGSRKEIELQRAHGDPCPVLVSATPVQDRRPLLCIVVTDLTERKKAEGDLRASEARFRALAEGAPIGIFQTDAGGKNVYINATGAEILGQAPSEVSGAGWETAIHPEDLPRVAREWGEAVSGNRVFSSKYRVRRKDGTVAVVQGYGAAIEGVSGVVTGFVGAMVDVTAQQELERQVELSARLAAMGTLVAGLSHEINNPLAAAISGGGLALEIAKGLKSQMKKGGARFYDQRIGDLEKAIEALEDAQEGNLRVSQIIRDMATFARPDAPHSRVKLIDVANDALHWLPASTTRSASIEVVDQGTPDVLASPGQLAQVVLNLVNNAIKATPDGERAHVVVRATAGDPGQARLEVIDHGVGIPPAMLPKVFEPFFTTRPVGRNRGTGLGLAICHAITRSHGGTITVESEVGKGSTFRVELPAAPAED